MRNMRIALVQLESVLGDVHRNLHAHLDWAQRAIDAGADLVCFPECSLTGYTTETAGKCALDFENAMREPLAQLARSSGTAIGYGFIEQARDCEKPFATYVIEPAGGFAYRKTHLGSRERFAFEAGNDLPVVQVADTRIGVQLCWEAHIPDIAGTLRAKGAELVLCPHAVGLGGQRRIASWERYLAARALDNGIFVAACNALRRAESGELRGGGLAVFGPDGALVANCASEREELLIADIGGPLPRETPDDGMRNISYHDRRRPELYR